MEKKFCLFAFNGDPMCFVHVLLNALDMHSKGYTVAVVIEGSATKLIKTFYENETALHRKLYLKLKENKLITAVCRACAATMGVLDAVKAEELPIAGDMQGHPSMSKYIEGGYTILTF